MRCSRTRTRLRVGFGVGLPKVFSFLSRGERTTEDARRTARPPGEAVEGRGRWARNEAPQKGAAQKQEPPCWTNPAQIPPGPKTGASSERNTSTVGLDRPHQVPSPFRRRTPSRGNRLTPVENGERADLRLYVVVLSGKSEVGKNLCRSGRALGQFHRQSPAALGIEAGRHRSTHRVDPFPKTDQPVPTLGGEPGQLGNHVVGHRDPQRVG